MNESFYYSLSQTWDNYRISRYFPEDGTIKHLCLSDCSDWPSSADSGENNALLDEAGSTIYHAITPHHPEAAPLDCWVAPIPSASDFGGMRWKYAEMLQNAYHGQTNSWQLFNISEADAVVSFYDNQRPLIETKDDAEHLLILTIDPNNVRVEQFYNKKGPQCWHMALGTRAVDAALVRMNLLPDFLHASADPAAREDVWKQYQTDEAFRSQLRLRMRWLRHRFLRNGDFEACREDVSESPAGQNKLLMRIDREMLAMALEQPLAKLLEGEPDLDTLLKGNALMDSSWLCSFEAFLIKAKKESGPIRTVLCNGADTAMTDLFLVIDRCLDMPDICCDGADDAVSGGTDLLLKPALIAAFERKWLEYTEEKKLPEIYSRQLLSPLYHVMDIRSYIRKAERYLFRKPDAAEVLSRAVSQLNLEYQKLLETELLAGLEERLQKLSQELNQLYKDFWQSNSITNWWTNVIACSLPFSEGMPDSLCSQVKSIAKDILVILNDPSILSLLRRDMAACYKNHVDDILWQDIAMKHIYERTKLGYLEAQLIAALQSALRGASRERIVRLFGPYSREAARFQNTGTEFNMEFFEQYQAKRLEQLRERTETAESRMEMNA